MSLLALACPAKINLGLEVVGRRPDGYHDLVTIFQAVSLVDTLSVTPADAVTLACSDPDLATTDNLCLRAADLLRQATGARQGARLVLTKRIPAAAGLGGGSSNAAATLGLLNALWGTGLTGVDLATLAARLGADVPFFTQGGAALATGMGDALTPLPDGPPRWFVLVSSPVTLPGKTARLYQALTPADWSDGTRTRVQVDRLRAGRPLDPDLIVNAFARPLRGLVAPVAAAEAALRAAGATTVFPAGSGPTLVALADSPAPARALARSMAAAGYQTWAVRSVPAWSPTAATRR